MFLVDKKIRIGIVGFGRMGVNHFKILSFLKNVEIVFVYDVKIKKNFTKKNVRFVKSIEKSEFKNIDAVFITAPTSLHFHYIKKFSKHIKNIFVEKPLASRIDHIRKIISLSKKNFLKIKVGYIERFNPAIKKMKKKIGNNKVLCADFFRTNPLGLRIKDVDVVTDLMVHDIDLSIFINGPIKSIEAYGKLEKKIIIFAEANFVHKNGALSRIIASRITKKKIRAINVTTKNNYIECDSLKKEIYVHTNLKIKNLKQKYFTYKGVGEVIEVSHEEPLLSEIKSFLLSCRGMKDKLLADCIDSYGVIFACEKIKYLIKKNDRFYSMH